MEFLNFSRFRCFPYPYLSPYALGIMAQYEEAWPWFCDVRTTLTNVAREHKNVTTEPLDYDVLITGAHVQMTSGSNGQNVLMQVSDLKSNHLWSVPGAILGSPCSAYGGVRSNVMPVIQLPEAFFLERGVRLKHEFKTYGLAIGGSVTWCGVRLIRPIKGGVPQTVVMPDGREIPIGSRLPWLNTIGLGAEISVIGAPAYVLERRGQFVGQSAVMDCPVTITDLSANWFVQDDVSTDPENLLLSLADKGQPRMWGARRGPSPSLLGQPTSAYPVQPLCLPYTVQPGDQLQFSVLNRNAVELTNGYITLRGVQHCI